MEIKTIRAEIKLSKNFQTYGVSMEATINIDEDNELDCVRELQAMCRKLAVEQRTIGA